MRVSFQFLPTVVFLVPLGCSAQDDTAPASGSAPSGTFDGGDNDPSTDAAGTSDTLTGRVDGCVFWCPVGADRFIVAGFETYQLTVPAVDHVGIVVHDVDEVARTWEEWFGIGPWLTVTTEGIDSAGNGLQVKRSYALSGDVEVELIQVLEGETPHRQFLETHGEGLHHVGFFVDDLERDATNLVAHGARAVMETPGESIFLESGGPGGAIFELVNRREKMTGGGAEGTTGKLQLPALAQLGFIVNDWRAVAESWERMFGFAPWSQLDLISFAGVDLGFSYPSGLELELIQPITGPVLHMDYLRDHGEGLHHIGFFVPGMDAEVDRLIAEGGQEILRMAGQFAYVGHPAFGGVIFEMMQPRGPY